MLVTWLLLCAQFAGASGFPIVRSATSKDTSRPYPCLDRPCGCLTYEACWAGDCCCFTLGQKLAWAEKRGIEAPAHARAKGPPEACDEKACCTKPKAASKWVNAAFVVACNGVHADAASAVPPALPPMEPISVAFLLPTSELEADAISDCGAPSRSDAPPTRPPKRG